MGISKGIYESCMESPSPEPQSIHLMFSKSKKAINMVKPGFALTLWLKAGSNMHCLSFSRVRQLLHPMKVWGPSCPCMSGDKIASSQMLRVDQWETRLHVFSGCILLTNA